MALAPSFVEMNIMRIGISCLLVLLATRVFAHVGDEIYPFFELLDEDLARIDLNDGSVEDWLEVIGEPSLTASDFYWLNYDYDPSELDFRIWLAWHQASNTVWVAMERFDDLYFNRYDGGGLSWMWLWDSSIAFLVDGDHTAGQYGEWIGAERDCETCTPERVLSHNRQAQRWMAIAEAPDGEILDYDGFSEWVVREPYALAGQRRHRPEPGDHGRRVQGDALRRSHLRRRGRLRGLATPSWQDHRVRHDHQRQRRY